MTTPSLALLPNARVQFLDGNGYPFTGGTVGFYIPGTLTPKDTWQDAFGVIANQNPLTLDDLGSATIWGDGIYRQILKDKAGNTIWDQETSTLGGSGGSGPAESIPTITQLRQSTNPASAPLIVEGYSTQADGGGGIYIYDVSDTTSTDNGGLVVVDAINQRWKRNYTGPAGANWFGVNTNGQSDPTGAINTWIGSGEEYLFLEKGAYNFPTLIAPAAQDMFFQADPAATFTGSGTLSFQNLIPFIGGPTWSEDLNAQTYGSEWGNYQNIFHRAAVIRSTIPSATISGGCNIVAQFSMGIGDGANSSVWGANIVGYSNNSTATSIGIELDFGCLVAGSTSHGLVIVSEGFAPSTNFIQIQTSNVNAVCKQGILFHNRPSGLISTTSGALLTCDGLSDTNPAIAAYGINFSNATFPVAEMMFPSFVVDATRSGGTTNRIHIQGNTDGSPPVMYVAGDNDANISMVFKPKGTGEFIWTDGAGTNVFRVNGNASGADTYLQTSAGAGSAVLSPNGTNANSNIFIQPKGTGNVTLRDSAGTNRVRVSTTGVGFNGTNPISIPALTGALSTVTDAAAKNVLTSIVNALTNYGLTTNGTT